MRLRGSIKLGSRNNYRLITYLLIKVVMLKENIVILVD